MQEYTVVKTPRKSLSLQPTSLTDTSLLPVFRFHRATFDWTDKNITRWFNGVAGSTYVTNDPKALLKKSISEQFSVHLRSNGLPLAMLFSHGLETGKDEKLIKHTAKNILKFIIDFFTQTEKNPDQIYVLQQQLQNQILQSTPDLQACLKKGAGISICGMYYDAKQRLQLLSVGIGSTLLAFVQNDHVETILPATVPRGTLLSETTQLLSTASSSTTTIKLDTHWTLDQRAIQAGDRLLFLTDGVYPALPCNAHRITHTDGTEHFEVQLQPHALKRISLAMLMEPVVKTIEKQIKIQQEKGGYFQVGDDVCVGECVVPSTADIQHFQTQIQSFLSLKLVKDHLHKHRYHLNTLEKKLAQLRAENTPLRQARILIDLTQAFDKKITFFIKTMQAFLGNLGTLSEKCHRGLSDTLSDNHWLSAINELIRISHQIPSFLNALDSVIKIYETVHACLNNAPTPKEKNFIQLFCEQLNFDKLSPYRKTHLQQGAADLALYYLPLIQAMREEGKSIGHFVTHLIERLCNFAKEKSQKIVPYERLTWLHAIEQGKASQTDLRVETTSGTKSLPIDQAIKRQWFYDPVKKAWAAREPASFAGDSILKVLLDQVTQILPLLDPNTPACDALTQTLLTTLRCDLILLTETIQRYALPAPTQPATHRPAVETERYYHRLTRDDLEAYAKQCHEGTIHSSLLDFIRRTYYPYVKFEQGLVLDGSALPLRGINLMHTDLRGCLFIETDFHGATLQGANVSGVSFRRANLQEALLQGLQCDDADFTDAKITNAMGVPKPKHVLLPHPTKAWLEKQNAHVTTYFVVMQSFLAALEQNPLSSVQKVQLFPFLVAIYLKNNVRAKTLEASLVLRAAQLERAFGTQEGVPHCAYTEYLKETHCLTLFKGIQKVALYQGFFEVVEKLLTLSHALRQDDALDETLKPILDNQYQQGIQAYLGQLGFYWQAQLLQCRDARQQETFLCSALTHYAVFIQTYELTLDKLSQIDLRTVKLHPGIKVNELDFSPIQWTADQIATMIGFSKTKGIEAALLTAAAIKKQQWATQTLQEQRWLIQQIALWGNALQHLPLLSCTGTPPDLDQLSSHLKPLTYSLLTSSQFNSLPDNHSQAFTKISEEDSETLWNRDEKSFRADLIDLLSAHQYRLSPMTLAQLRSSRLNRYLVEVGETIFLDDVKVALPDLPANEATILLQTLNEIRTEQKQIESAIKAHLTLADKAYLQSLIDILHEKKANAAEKQDALEELITFIQGQNHLQANLRQADLSSIDFKTVKLPLNAYICFNSLHIQKHFTTDQRTAYWNALASAIQQGDQTQVIHWLKRGIDINHTGDDGRTALMMACYQGEVSIARYLLDHGADPSKRSFTNTTCVDTVCFNQAAYGRSRDAILLLLSQHPSSQPLFSLHHYVAIGDLNAVKTHLTPKTINASHVYEQLTPLHVAVLTRQLRCAALLLREGANPSLQNRSHQTPFEVACLEGHLPMVELLWQGQPAVLNTVDRLGHCFLYRVAKKHITIAQRLVEYGAKVGVKEAILLEDRPRLVKLLDKQRPPYCDDEGNSLLHLALRYEKSELAIWLIEQGVHTIAGNQTKEYPLSLAAYHGLFDVVKALIAKKVPVESLLYPISPILLAIDANHTETILYLLNAGANVNATHPQLGYTTLQQAIRHQNLPVIKQLVEKGATFQLDASGNTLLHKAAKTGDPTLVNWLLENILSFKNNRQETVLNLLPSSIRDAVKSSGKEKLTPLFSESSKSTTTTPLPTTTTPTRTQSYTVPHPTQSNQPPVILQSIVDDPTRTGFHALGTTRHEVARLLRARAKERETREPLHADIAYAFTQRWLDTPHYQMLQRGLAQAQTVWADTQKKIQQTHPWLNHTAPENWLAALLQRSEQVDYTALKTAVDDVAHSQTAMMMYYLQENTLLAYANALEETTMPLYYATAFFYAHAKGLSLSIWEAVDEKTLTLRHCHEAGKSSERMRHFLIREKTPQFDELTATTSEKITPSPSSSSTTALKTIPAFETFEQVEEITFAEFETPQPQWYERNRQSTERAWQNTALWQWCQTSPDTKIPLKTAQWVSLYEIQKSIQTPDAAYGKDYMDTLMASFASTDAVCCYPATPLTGLRALFEATLPKPIASSTFILLPLHVDESNPIEKTVLNHWTLVCIDTLNHRIYCLDPANQPVDPIAQEIASLLEWENTLCIHNPTPFPWAEKNNPTVTSDYSVYMVEMARCVLEAIAANTFPTVANVEKEVLENYLTILFTEGITQSEEANTLVRKQHTEWAHAYLVNCLPSGVLGQWMTGQQAELVSYTAVYSGSTCHLWQTWLNQKEKQALACTNRSASTFFRALSGKVSEVEIAEKPLEVGEEEKESVRVELG